MNVYVDNLLSKATNLTVDTLAENYTKDLLYSDAISDGVLFDSNEGRINANVNFYFDSIAILGSNFTTGSLGYIYMEGGEERIMNIEFISCGENTIIKMPNPEHNIIAFTIGLYSIDQLKVGILFVGNRIELPLFNVGFKYQLNMQGKAERTRTGIVFGEKLPVLRSFGVSFSDIDTPRRQVMERYIENVQYVQPHLVEPYETDDVPPVWAVLTDCGEFGKENGPGFRWSAGLKYMEAK